MHTDVLYMAHTQKKRFIEIGSLCVHSPVSEVRPIQPAAITTPKTAAASSSKTTLVLGSRLCITETHTDSGAVMHRSKTVSGADSNAKKHTTNHEKKCKTTFKTFR